MTDKEVTFEGANDLEDGGYLKNMAVFIGTLVEHGFNYKVREIKSEICGTPTPCWSVTIIPNENQTEAK